MCFYLFIYLCMGSLFSLLFSLFLFACSFFRRKKKESLVRVVNGLLIGVSVRAIDVLPLFSSSFLNILFFC